MATRAEKNDRRWLVIKGLLIGLAIYTLTIAGMFIGGLSILQLDHLTTMVFGLVGGFGVSNWMSKPSEDD